MRCPICLAAILFGLAATTLIGWTYSEVPAQEAEAVPSEQRPWPEMPDDKEWADFLRHNDVPNDISAPPPTWGR